MEVLRATYRLDVDPADAAARAGALALEQTAELPREALGPDALVGTVETVEADPGGAIRATIAYPAEATAADPGQLLNVLFGNVAMQPDVSLVGLEIPDAIAATIGGPSHGIHGLRAATGVEGRPLTCVALKAMGEPPATLAERAAAFARAGVDVIKDDHGLADAPGCSLEARLEAVGAALDRQADATGRRALYASNLIGTPRALARGLARAVEKGAGAALVAPMLAGLPAFRELSAGSPVPLIAHPAFAATRIAPAVLLGTLFRLYGADAAIFPHAGGRFPIDEVECRALAANLAGPAGGIRPAMPAPGGGTGEDRVAEMVGIYGIDCMLLAGGTLYRGDALEASARAFVRRVAALAPAERPA